MTTNIPSNNKNKSPEKNSSAPESREVPPPSTTAQPETSRKSKFFSRKGSKKREEPLPQWKIDQQKKFKEWEKASFVTRSLPMVTKKLLTFDLLGIRTPIQHLLLQISINPEVGRTRDSGFGGFEGTVLSEQRIEWI
jgi:hypothetical protein